MTLKLLGSNLQQIYSGLRGITAKPSFISACIDYDKYWEFRDFFSFQPRFPIIEKQISDNSSVLDIGCGDGGMLAYIKSRKKIAELGIDISKVATAKARKLGVNSRVDDLFKLAVENTSPQKRWDYVILSEVVEHVADSEEFLKAAWKICERTLILTFPNIAYLPHRLRLLFGRFPVQWVYHQSEHLRFWSLKDIHDWFEALHLPQATVRRKLIPSNGITMIGLHCVCPNLFGNQIIAFIDRLKQNSHES